MCGVMFAGKQIPPPASLPILLPMKPDIRTEAPQVSMRLQLKAWSCYCTLSALQKRYNPDEDRRNLATGDGQTSQVCVQ